MAITTYAELVTAIGSWTHRSDLASIAPDFIMLAEQRIYHGSEDPEMPSPPLRIRLMEERDTGTASNGLISIPTGYLETIVLKTAVNGESFRLEYKPPSDNAYYQGQSGNARFYSRVNEGIYVGPQTAAYTHDYYKRFDALTVSATTNTLLTNYPHLYLYGCLVEAMPYIGKDARLSLWYRMFNASLRGLNNSDRKSVKAQSGLAVVPG
jgi:hypothetical protein